MKTMSRFLAMILLVFVTVSVNGCVTAKQKKLDAGINPMTDEELKTLFSKPLSASYYSTKRGITSKVTYQPDGSQTIENSKISDKGTYTIINGEQCSKWDTIRKGAEKCTTWFDIGNNKYEIYEANGAKTGTITVE